MPPTPRVNLFVMGKEDWAHVRNVNKGIEERLLKILKRRSQFDPSIPTVTDSDVSLDPNNSTNEGPRLLLKAFELGKSGVNLMRYFNIDRLRNYLVPLNYEVNSDDNSVLDVDYKLRGCVDLLFHIQSRASCETAAASSLHHSSLGGHSVDSVNSAHHAYNSPFAIHMIPPDKRKCYNSCNAPSFSELFLALCNGVNATLRRISRGDGVDVTVVESCCLHIDLFIGRKGAGAEFVRDILEDYSSLGHLSKDKTVKQSVEGISEMFEHVSNVDPSRFPSIGKTNSDLGFSFAPCGFLLPYHVGVISLLSELSVLNLTTPLCGGSSGAVGIVCVTCAIPDIRDAMASIEVTSNNAFISGTRYRLDDIIRSALESGMKPGTYLAVNNRLGKITITMASRVLMSYKGKFISNFTDNTDLSDGIRASCNIPGFSTKGTVFFRGEKCYDGYLGTKFRELGCHDTDANRTIRVFPFLMGASSVRRQNLRNDYVCPLLVEKDKYVVHYLRLKSLIRELWQRKLDYEREDKTSEWCSELSLMIDAYDKLMSTGESHSRTSTWSRLMNIWRFKHPTDRFRVETSAKGKRGANSSSNRNEKEPDLARLFMLVIASESAHKVGPDSRLSARNWRGKLQDVDLMNKFGRGGFSSLLHRMNFMSTPYCLIDWLRYEATSAQFPRSTADMELSTLKGLLHAITPPDSLSYYYTEFPYLLPNGMGNMRRLNITMSSCDKADTRYLFDIGRCDAFRWLIGEYISFENWLHLRIRQLEESKKTESSVYPGGRHENNVEADTEMSKKPLHARQHDELCDMLDFMDTASLSDPIAAKGVHHSPQSSLFTVQNRLVRRALMIDAVDTHYLHILCHSHLWMG